MTNNNWDNLFGSTKFHLEIGNQSSLQPGYTILKHPVPQTAERAIGSSEEHTQRYDSVLQ